MATEVKRDRVLGNFRPSKADQIRAKARGPRERRERRPGNSDEHLAALRKCPCAATLRMPAGEVHHLKYGIGERGVGQRSTDRWGIPLSRHSHEEVERVGSQKEHAKLAEMGIVDPIGLAAALWAASPDISKMTRIVIAHRKRGA